jgi:hypothetical protein
MKSNKNSIMEKNTNYNKTERFEFHNEINRCKYFLSELQNLEGNSDKLKSEFDIDNETEYTNLVNHYNNTIQFYSTLLN